MAQFETPPGLAEKSLARLLIAPERRDCGEGLDRMCPAVDADVDKAYPRFLDVTI